MKKLRYIGWSILIFSVVGSLHWLYDYHYTSEDEQQKKQHWAYVDYYTSKGKPRDRESMFHNYKKRNSLVDETGYCDCVSAGECKNDIQLINTYKKGDFNVNFFGPLCIKWGGVNEVESKAEYGYSNQTKGESCKKCSTIMTITDQQDNVVLTGVDGWNYKGSDGYMDYPDDRSDITKEQFGNQSVRLVEMPDDFPYLVLSDTSIGSWGLGYSYHFYSTKGEFKKVAEVGPDWGYGGEGYDGSKGIYTDKDGNYMIDLQTAFWPYLGGNSSRILEKLPYRFNSEAEFKRTGKMVVFVPEIMKESVITFTDNEIFRLMANAKEYNKKEITEASVKTLSKDEYGYQETSPKWPFKLLNGYVYGNLFNLIRNGRIDLAKEYFYTIIPEGYDTYSILPQSLNTREKLWKGYLRRLKESSSFIGLDSQGNALSPSVEHKKNVYWSVLEDLNGGLL
jgi:hypothetical protein